MRYAVSTRQPFREVTITFEEEADLEWLMRETWSAYSHEDKAPYNKKQQTRIHRILREALNAGRAPRVD